MQHYELDFSLGAEVDLGCGTAVVGDATNDGNVPKSQTRHPLSMFEFSYQWTEGRAAPNSVPPDPGFYPQRCPRFHRFTVTKPGNFTFVRCSRARPAALSFSPSFSIFVATCLRFHVCMPPAAARGDLVATKLRCLRARARIRRSDAHVCAITTAAGRVRINDERRNYAVQANFKPVRGGNGPEFFRRASLGGRAGV